MKQKSQEKKGYCKSVLQYSMYLRFKTCKTITLFIDTNIFRTMFPLGNGEEVKERGYTEGSTPQCFTSFLKNLK